MNQVFEIVLTADTDQLEDVAALLEAAMPGEVELHDVLRITTYSNNARTLVADACKRLMAQRNNIRMGMPASVEGGLS